MKVNKYFIFTFFCFVPIVAFSQQLELNQLSGINRFREDSVENNIGILHTA